MAKINLALGLILLLSLLGSSTPADASQDEVKWSTVNIPTEGKVGNWVLASGSDIQHLTIAIDGTFYAYGKGLTYTLYKSTDGGYSWSYTGKVNDPIVCLVTAPDDASIIYYATSFTVYKSTDGGSSFISLPPNPGGAGSNNIEIASLAVAQQGSSYIIAVGTKDSDPGQFGGVYTLDEGGAIAWTDTAVGNYDVYAVAFSPNYDAFPQLTAVVNNEASTIVTAKVGDGGWGNTIGDATIAISNIITADIAFPSNYNPDVATGTFIEFVAIDSGSGSGDVYKINNMRASSVAIDLNISSAYDLNSIDVTTVAINGNANLMAGAANSAQVYLSTDRGNNWIVSTKEPTGDGETYVVMAPDFATSGRAYAATSGTESAFSCTSDGGITWNQLGLIDTSITTIVDLAPSPNYSQDDTLFMLTWGGKHSLWRSLSGGIRWERIFTSTVANVDSIKLAELSPYYNNASQVVFLAGLSNGNAAIWRSTDNGQSFSSPRVAHDPTGATLSIDAWAVANDDTLFIGSYDGANGLVYGTTNSGWSYSVRAVAGSQSLNSIALSPDYEQDKTILVGNTNGWVYWSNDNGASFEPLPWRATSPPLTGSVAVAFDPQFNSNHTVYAASSTASEGIYRFIIGTSTSWKSIDSPTGGMFKQLKVSANDALYATNFKANGGMERCLNPTYSLGPTFETVTRGLDSGVTLFGLWLCDDRLWSIDTTNNSLMTYFDSLTSPVILTSPANKAPGIGTIINYTISNVSLDWEVLTGATSYKWQLNYNTDFSTIPAGFEGNTNASSVQLPTLQPDTTYYWRVRATEPVLSLWSAKWSFTTSLGIESNAPGLTYPEAGAKGAPIKPVFQWSAIAGADSYELVVSTDVYFSNPSVLKIDAYALPSTAWQSNISLNYDITYYWKVRAISSNTYSSWSAVGAFTTESAPSAPSPPQPSSTQQATPDWVIYLVGALLLTIVLLLITMLVLVVIVRRP